MSKAMDAFYRFLDEPIFPWARVVLAFLTIFVGLSFMVPMWHINMKAPQYPQGLDLYIYSYKVDGGNDGNDVQEINVLNHYIGMQEIDLSVVPEMALWPLAVVGSALLLVLAALCGCDRDTIMSERGFRLPDGDAVAGRERLRRAGDVETPTGTFGYHPIADALIALDDDDIDGTLRHTHSRAWAGGCIHG